MGEQRNVNAAHARKPREKLWVKLAFLAAVLMIAALVYINQRRGPKLSGNWGEDLAAALVRAGDSNRPVLVFFMYDPPGESERDLETRVLGKAENVKAISDGGFIPVKARLKPDTDLARKYDIKTLPVLMILNAQGREIKRCDRSIGEVAFRSQFLDVSKP